MKAKWIRIAVWDTDELDWEGPGWYREYYQYDAYSGEQWYRWLRLSDNPNFKVDPGTARWLNSPEELEQA